MKFICLPIHAQFRMPLYTPASCFSAFLQPFSQRRAMQSEQLGSRYLIPVTEAQGLVDECLLGGGDQAVEEVVPRGFTRRDGLL